MHLRHVPVRLTGAGSMKKRRLGAAMLACAALVSTACSGAESGDTSAQGLMPVRLVIGNNVAFDVAAFDAVAEAQGFYKDEGIEVTRREYVAGGDAVQLLASDSVDLALGVGMFAALAGVANAPIDIVSSQWQGYSDVIYYVPAESAVQSLADVGGLSVATSRPGSSTDALCQELQAQITADGRDGNSCEPIGSPADVYTAVTTGQVDVGWTTPPFFFDSLHSGELRQIGLGDDIDRYRSSTSRVSLVRQQLIADDPEKVQAFFRAFQRAIDWTFDNTKEAAEIWGKAADIEITPELRKAVFELYTPERVSLNSFERLDVSLSAAEEFGALTEPLTEDELRQRIVADSIIEAK